MPGGYGGFVLELGGEPDLERLQQRLDLLVGQLHAHEYGIPAREKIVAVNGRWIAGTSLRQS